MADMPHRDAEGLSRVMGNCHARFLGEGGGGATAPFPDKGRNRCNSFGFKEYGNGFKLDGRRLRLFGIRRVAVRWHRPIEGTIKSVRIKRKAGKWYACLACEVEQPEPKPATGQAVGLDVGIASLITTSDGEKVENPKWYRIEQRKLRVLQRRVARRKKGRNRRRKAVLVLQRQHERIRNKPQGLSEQAGRRPRESLRHDSN